MGAVGLLRDTIRSYSGGHRLHGRRAAINSTVGRRAAISSAVALSTGVGSKR